VILLLFLWQKISRFLPVTQAHIIAEFVMTAARPAFMSRATLARALDIAESTVDDFVRRGVIPRPVRLTSGCVRWDWLAVRAAMASLADSGSCTQSDDPFMAGVENVVTTQKRRSVAA
jgi:predicted DNA-binding transcriptional regulator AlpA